MLSADEKTSIQARLRWHPSLPPAPGYPASIEHDYERGGALAYLAAWDVRRGRVQGRCATTTGKAPFGRLVDQVMRQEPYRSAPRVSWVVDNGSSHRSRKAARELEARCPTLIVVHLPAHASWLNQVEIYRARPSYRPAIDLAPPRGHCLRPLPSLVPVSRALPFQPIALNLRIPPWLHLSCVNIFAQSTTRRTTSRPITPNCATTWPASDARVAASRAHLTPCATPSSSSSMPGTAANYTSMPTQTMPAI